MKRVYFFVLSLFSQPDIQNIFLTANLPGMIIKPKYIHYTKENIGWEKRLGRYLMR